MYKKVEFYGYPEHTPEDKRDILTYVDFPGIGMCEITVKGVEQTDIPHFHVRSVDWKGNKDGILDSCLEIFYPRYFTEERCDKLTPEQLSIVNNALKRKYRDYDKDDWIIMVYDWESLDNDTSLYDKLYDEFEKENKLIQPDYTKVV